MRCKSFLRQFLQIVFGGVRVNINDTFLIKHLANEVRDLEKSLAVAVEALEFYKKRDHWNDDYPGGIACEDGCLDTGETAQQALKEIQEGK